jgi:hypothetical protein
MPSVTVSASKAKQIAEVIATAADQYLFSYIILTRFEECQLYSIGFTMAHCIELSIKAVHWLKLRKAPDNHRIEKIIEELKPVGIGHELEKLLPDSETRKAFHGSVDEINKASFMEMMKGVLKINPNLDDDKWMVLYAILRSVNVKYGVDKHPAILQLLAPVKPRLNKMALGLIGCARTEFPDKDRHQRELLKFVDKLPKQYSIVDAIIKQTQEKELGGKKKRIKSVRPIRLPQFKPEELALIRRALSL